MTKPKEVWLRPMPSANGLNRVPETECRTSVGVNSTGKDGRKSERAKSCWNQAASEADSMRRQRTRRNRTEWDTPSESLSWGQKFHK